MKKIGIVLLVIVLVFIAVYIANNRESSQDFLDDEFAKIENYIPKRDVKNTTISQADVAWHLDHILKTINQISTNLENSNPNNYQSTFSLQQVIVHTTGTIPRGVAQSPQSVRPPDIILTEAIFLQLKQAKEHLDKINSLDENAFIEHPVFKNLDRDQTRRFIKIHTKHHLKIIKDILED